MSERSEVDPITNNAIAFMRRRRKELGWSAAYLAEVCLDYGAAQEPPVLPRLVAREYPSLKMDRVRYLRWMKRGCWQVPSGLA